eukprot:scaffold1567_cov106-Isochrysis_galbana.AAC.10
MATSFRTVRQRVGEGKFEEAWTTARRRKGARLAPGPDETLAELDALEHALHLERAHAQAEVAVPNLLHGAGDAGHRARLGNELRNVDRPPAEALAYLAHRRYPCGAVLEVGQLAHVRLRDSAQVVAWADERLANTVDGGEGTEDKGELWRQQEGLVGLSREEVLAELGPAGPARGLALLRSHLVLPLIVGRSERALEGVEHALGDALDGEAVDALPEDAHLLERVACLLRRILVDGEDQVDEPLFDALLHPLHHAKVVVDEPAARVAIIHRQVARVRVAVEESVPADLLEVRVGQRVGQVLRVEALGFDAILIGQLEAGAKLHRHQPATQGGGTDVRLSRGRWERGKSFVFRGKVWRGPWQAQRDGDLEPARGRWRHLWDLDCRVTLEVACKLLRRHTLDIEVDLAVENLPARLSDTPPIRTDRFRLRVQPVGEARDQSDPAHGRLWAGLGWEAELKARAKYAGFKTQPPPPPPSGGPSSVSTRVARRPAALTPSATPARPACFPPVPTRPPWRQPQSAPPACVPPCVARAVC